MCPIGWYYTHEETLKTCWFWDCCCWLLLFCVRNISFYL